MYKKVGESCPVGTNKFWLAADVLDILASIQGIQAMFCYRCSLLRGQNAEKQVTESCGAIHVTPSSFVEPVGLLSLLLGGSVHILLSIVGGGCCLC
jgi:hypothetical protein